MDNNYKIIEHVFNEFYLNNFKQHRPKKPRIYEAGHMQYVKNMGSDWRNKIEKRLTDVGFSVFNPASKDKLKWEAGLFKECTKKNYDINKVKGWSYDIILKDIYELVKCDIVLCKWVYGVISAGTPSELTIAKLFNIPVLMVFDDDIKKIPLWVLGTVTEHAKDFKGIENKLWKLYEEHNK